MKMDLYKLKDLVCEWERQYQNKQYQGWSNPVTNLIAYQVNYLTDTLPFSFQQNDRHNNVQKLKRQNTFEKSEAKNDYGVIELKNKFDSITR